MNGYLVVFVVAKMLSAIIDASDSMCSTIARVRTIPKKLPSTQYYCVLLIPIPNDIDFLQRFLQLDMRGEVCCAI